VAKNAPPILTSPTSCGKRGIAAGSPAHRRNIFNLGWDRKSSVMPVFPIVFRLPAMILAVPPLMVFIPAALTLGVQVSPAIVGLATVVAMVMDGMVEICFGFFDGMLAFFAIIRVKTGRRRQEKHQRANCKSCDECVSKFSVQSQFSCLYG
jgi:hypothetical protein